MLTRVLELLKERNLFLTGGAGVGKSHLTREVIAAYKKELRPVVALGSTGISAVHLGGQTLHSFFVFGIADSLEALVRQDRHAKSRLKELYRILQRTELIVIDEISMVGAQTMEMVLYRLRASGFEGRLMVVGDFYQLPPIRKASPQGSIFDEAHYAFESSAWEVFDFLSIELTRIKRTRNEDFMRILERVRRAEVDHEVVRYLEELRHTPLEDVLETTTLFGRNLEADRINRERIASLATPAHQMPARLSVADPHLSPKRIAAWKRALPVSEELELKEGAKVLFCANKWGSYHNGERGEVVHIEEERILVEVAHRLVAVERHAFTMQRFVVNEKGEVAEETLCSLAQFPLRLAYAITIHKSQGMSLERLICNVDRIFAESQFYVALSRAVDPARLRIDYNGSDFAGYLRRTIRVSEAVRAFYRDLQTLRLD